MTARTNSTQENSLWLSIAETAGLLSIRPDQVMALIDEGRIPAHKHTTGDGSRGHCRILRSGSIETLLPSQGWFSPPEISRLTGMGSTFVLELLRGGFIGAYAHNSKPEGGGRTHYRVSHPELLAYLRKTATYVIGTVTLQPPGNASALR